LGANKKLYYFDKIEKIKVTPGNPLMTHPGFISKVIIILLISTLNINQR
jgi:hypothetical protein